MKRHEPITEVAGGENLILYETQAMRVCANGPTTISVAKKPEGISVAITTSPSGLIIMFAGVRKIKPLPPLINNSLQSFLIS